MAGKITLTRRGDHYEVHNPTAYYVTIVDALSGLGGKSLNGFSR